MYGMDNKSWESFAESQALDMTPYKTPSYENTHTEKVWLAWEKGLKFRAMKEGRSSRQEPELFFGNNIREAIREFKSFFTRR